MLYIGCPIWSYKGWVGNFFPPHTPQGDFLRLYSRRLTSVEGNTTFYAVPSVETIARWRAETPPEFRFCPKIPRTISHTANLDAHQAEVRFLTERMRGLGTRLGTMFLQLPPAFSPTQLSQLEAFLGFWPTDLQLAVEVRHLDFYKEPGASALNTLLSQHNEARVMMDTRAIRTGSTEEKEILQARERKPDLPLQLAITADIAFVRYIGHPRMEVNEPLIETWAQQLAQWLQQGITLYVFCHCPFEVHSPVICYTLYQRVRALTPLPPLHWKPEQFDVGPEQARLL